MALSRPKDPLEESDICSLKVDKALKKVSPINLRIAFHWISGKDPTQSFDNYFLGVIGLSKRQYGLYFQKDQISKMESDVSGETFDVSLLHSCFKYGCGENLSKEEKDWKEGDERRIESNLAGLKRIRNDIAHNTEIDEAKMDEYLQKIQKYLENILRLSAKFSNDAQKEIDQKVKEMKINIKEIRDCCVFTCDPEEHNVTKLKEQREKLKKMIKENGVPELKENYRNLSNIDPGSFILGKKGLKVKTVYTALELMRDQGKFKEEEEAKKQSNSAVDYRDMLVLKSDCDQNPMIIIIEGDAGAGKSTLVKLFLAEWSADEAPDGSSPTVKGIKEYDLVLYSEFRNKNISSLLSLLDVLLPETSKEMDDKDLIRCIGDFKVLILFDGLDEINETSDALLRELYERHLQSSGGKMQMLITTRPNKVRDLPTICTNKPKLHLRLNGVKHDKRIEFLQRLHDELIKENQSNAQTEGLVDYFKRSQARMGDHFRLPLNLTLLAYLWANDSGIVDSVTTCTGLYIAFHEVIKLHLISRLKNSIGLHIDHRVLETKCDEYLKLFYRICFDTHACSFVELPEKYIEELEKKCKDLQLPADDMWAAFLNVHNKPTLFGCKFSLEAPHKIIFEHYVAQYFVLRLCQSHDDIENENRGEKVSIESILKKKLGPDVNEEKLNYFQNVLIHLGGLMHHKDPKLLEEHSQNLIFLLKKSGMEESSWVLEKEWLTPVAETNCNNVFTKSVADNISIEEITQMDVCDGHCGAALAFLKYIPQSLRIIIILEHDITYNPKLPELLDEISTRDSALDLCLYHHWMNPLEGASDELLRTLLAKNRCKVTHFKGNLEDPSVLPSDTRDLWLSMTCNEHAKKICHQLPLLFGNRSLEILGFHILKEVSPEALTPLDGSKYSLWFTDVTDQDIDKVVQSARALLAEDKNYYNLLFPSSGLTASGVKNLFRQLVTAGIDLLEGGFSVSSPNITEEEELKNFAQQQLKCSFALSSDEWIWKLAY